MEKVVFETVVHAPKEEVYDFLLAFENYGRYSSHIKDVSVVRDNPVEWEITVKWWRLSYTARSRLTGMEEDKSISWKVIKDVNARGIWTIEEIDSVDEAEVTIPEDPEEEVTTRVTLDLWYEPSDADKVNPSRFLPTSRIVSLLKPVVIKEGQKVLRRVVADLEGEPRDVDLDITQKEIDRDEIDFDETMEGKWKEGGEV